MPSLSPSRSHYNFSLEKVDSARLSLGQVNFLEAHRKTPPTPQLLKSLSLYHSINPTVVYDVMITSSYFERRPSSRVVKAQLELVYRVVSSRLAKKARPPGRRCIEYGQFGFQSSASPSERKGNWPQKCPIARLARAVDLFNLIIPNANKSIERANYSC